MDKLQTSKGKLMTKIFEYQKFIKLNLQFISALEEEGADTSLLREEIIELEGKVAELQLRMGHAH